MIILFMNRDRLRKYKSGHKNKNDFRIEILTNWQKKVLDQLPNSKANLRNDKSDSNLLKYLKLRLLYYLAGYLCKEFNSLRDKKNDVNNDTENIFFKFLYDFNGRIDVCLSSDDKTTFFWICQNINDLEKRIKSSKNGKNLLGNIKDLKVMPGYSYSKIVDFNRDGMKDNAVYDKAIKCRDPKTTSII